jgi:hypothetical protein
MNATTKQIDYILSLASEVMGRPIRWVSEAESVLPISKTATRRQLSKSEASACISSLLRRLGR